MAGAAVGVLAAAWLREPAMTAVLALGGAVAVMWFLRVLVVTLLPASRLPEPCGARCPTSGRSCSPRSLPPPCSLGPAHRNVGRAGVAVTGVVVWRTNRIGLATAVGLLTAGLLGLP